MRGRLLVGLSRPGRVRVEGLAPFGQPLFILAATARGATLWLPRERRVLRNPSAADILAALAGVAVEPDELLDLVTGCVAAGQATGGRAYPVGWYALDFDGAATAFLRRAGSTWRVVAGQRRSWTVEYQAYDGRWPVRLRLRTAHTDLFLRFTQVETNVPLGPEAFTVEVPEGAEPMTLEELRAAGPLGARRAPSW